MLNLFVFGLGGLLGYFGLTKYKKIGQRVICVLSLALPIGMGFVWATWTSAALIAAGPGAGPFVLFGSFVPVAFALAALALCLLDLFLWHVGFKIGAEVRVASERKPD